MDDRDDGKEVGRTMEAKSAIEESKRAIRQGKKEKRRKNRKSSWRRRKMKMMEGREERELMTGEGGKGGKRREDGREGEDVESGTVLDGAKDTLRSAGPTGQVQVSCRVLLSNKKHANRFP